MSKRDQASFLVYSGTLAWKGLYYLRLFTSPFQSCSKSLHSAQQRAHQPGPAIESLTQCSRERRCQTESHIMSKYERHAETLYIGT